MMEGQHDRLHWGCCWMPLAGKLLWLLGLADLIGGLVAYWRGGEFLTVAAGTWLWFALVKGVLAIGAKASKHHWCAHQMQK